MGKKVLNESTQFCGLKGVLCYKSSRYLRGREWKAFDRGVFWWVPTVVHVSTSPFICRWLVSSLSPLLSHDGRWWRAETVHAGVRERHRLALVHCGTLPAHRWGSGSIYWIGQAFCAALQGRTNISGLQRGTSFSEIKAGHITPGQRILKHQNICLFIRRQVQICIFDIILLNWTKFMMQRKLYLAYNQVFR